MLKRCPLAKNTEPSLRPSRKMEQNGRLRKVAKVAYGISGKRFAEIRMNNRPKKKNVRQSAEKMEKTEEASPSTAPECLLPKI
jgi:hypothetical protein